MSTELALVGHNSKRQGYITMEKVLCVGAGLTGAVIARHLADQGLSVTVIDERNHIAGNCFCRRDPETGILMHNYGPHIFHTSRDAIWKYVNLFAEFKPYVSRVKAVAGGQVYSLPINLLTINKFFGKSFTPSEAKAFLEDELAEKSIINPLSLEEQALRFVGRELYEAFFKGYTLKQWGIHPRNLPASILQRLPVRFDKNDNYFSDTFQGIPEAGYTELVREILNSAKIHLRLNTRFEDTAVENYQHVFYSGRIDRYFSYKFGQLDYRTLDFEHFYPTDYLEGEYQGCAVMNFCDQEVPYTRIVEHKHFAPWESHEKTICTREFSRNCTADDSPFYPVRMAGGSELLNRYLKEAGKTENVTFAGRLGTHQYLDMDDAIVNALQSADEYLDKF